MVVVAERQSQREQPDNRIMCMYQPAGITETDINLFLPEVYNIGRDKGECVKHQFYCFSEEHFTKS